MDSPPNVLSGIPDNGAVSLNSYGNKGDVCILSLLSEDSEQPVARSYDGRDWEVSAGAFVDRVKEPDCTDRGACTFIIPIDAKTLDDGDDGDKKYILTSYSHSVTSK